MDSVLITYVVGHASLTLDEQVTDRLVHSQTFITLLFLVGIVWIQIVFVAECTLNCSYFCFVFFFFWRNV